MGINTGTAKIILGVILILGLTAGYFYRQKLVTNNSAEEQTKQIVTEVGKLMLLPEGAPTIATVTDKSKLQDQKFFINAENGDRVLIYSASSKAILYRPKINKIIEVASILPVDNPVTPATPTMAEVKPPITNAKIVLMNGTKTVGLTTKWEKSILGKIASVDVVDKLTAGQTDYTNTVIVDISGKYKGKVDELKNLFGATVVPAPSGESVPQADILVILGSDAI